MKKKISSIPTERERERVFYFFSCKKNSSIKFCPEKLTERKHPRPTLLRMRIDVNKIHIDFHS